MTDTLGPLRPDEEKLFAGQPKGFPLGDFNIDDVMLPEGDDFGVPSDDDSIGDEEIETETGFGSVIGEPPVAGGLCHSRGRCMHVNTLHGEQSTLASSQSQEDLLRIAQEEIPEVLSLPCALLQSWTTCPECLRRSWRS